MNQRVVQTVQIELARTASAKLAAGSNIDVGELAALLDVNYRTVGTYARTGQWPSQLIGSARRFSPDDVAHIRQLAAVPATAAPRPVGA